MGTFFTDVQSLFQNKYHGRYLGLILQEIGNRHANFIGQFIFKSCGLLLQKKTTIRFVAEYEFKVGASRRRADLAIFVGDTTEPIVLIEIKYFDKPTKAIGTKPAQLADYKKWKSEKNGRAVLVLAREQIITSDLVVKRWNDLSNYLKTHKGQHGELISLLIDYLEDEGIVMQNIDAEQVIAFMKRITCSWRDSGRNAGKLDGPMEFSKLLKNMKLTAEIFDQYFKEGSVERTVKAASVDFSITIRAKNSKLNDGEIVIDNQNKAGGDVCIYAQNNLKEKEGWMVFRYGILMEILSENSHHENAHPKTYLFAEVDGKEVRKSDLSYIFSKKIIKFTDVTSKAEIRSGNVELAYRKLLMDISQKVLESKIKLNDHQKKRISNLHKDLSRDK